MAAIEIDEEELRARLQEAFAAVDADEDGVISHDDLKGALEGAGYTPTDDIVEAIIARADEDGSGNISFEEFAKAIIILGIKIRIIMALKRAFVAMDVDNTGYITVDNLKTLRDEVGATQITDERIEEVFGNCDANDDGAVNFEEFLVAIRAALDEAMAE